MGAYANSVSDLATDLPRNSTPTSLMVHPSLRERPMRATLWGRCSSGSRLASNLVGAQDSIGSSQPPKPRSSVARQHVSGDRWNGPKLRSGTAEAGARLAPNALSVART
jgi:hypothetical protein